jgi:hypothetical protein
VIGLKMSQVRPYNGRGEFDALQWRLSILVKEMLPKRLLLNDHPAVVFITSGDFGRLGMTPDNKRHFGAHSA